MAKSLRTRILLVVLASALILTACGGGGDSSSSDDAQLATLDTETPDEQASDTDVTLAGDDDSAADEPELTFEDAQLDFAQCMRDGGYSEWPDPDPTADAAQGAGRVDLEALGIDPRDEAFRDAQQTCREVFDGIAGGGQDLSPEQQAELEDNLLALFACVRATPGFEDIPDPDFTSDQGFGLRELFQNGGFDPQEFRGLLQDCQAELGIEDFGGQGGGRGPGRGAPAAGANA